MKQSCVDLGVSDQKHPDAFAHNLAHNKYNLQNFVFHSNGIHLITTRFIAFTSVLETKHGMEGKTLIASGKSLLTLIFGDLIPALDGLMNFQNPQEFKKKTQQIY